MRQVPTKVLGAMPRQQQFCYQGAIARQIVHPCHRLLEARAPSHAQGGMPRMAAMAAIFHVAVIAADQDQSPVQVDAFGQPAQEAIQIREMRHGFGELAPVAQ